MTVLCILNSVLVTHMPGLLPHQSPCTNCSLCSEHPSQRSVCMACSSACLDFLLQCYLPSTVCPNPPLTLAVSSESSIPQPLPLCYVLPLHLPSHLLTLLSFSNKKNKLCESRCFVHFVHCLDQSFKKTLDKYLLPQSVWNLGKLTNYCKRQRWNLKCLAFRSTIRKLASKFFNEQWFYNTLP